MENYKLDLPEQELRDLGFRYDNNLHCFIYRFALHRYKRHPVIFGKIGVDEETKDVWITICDGDGNTYTPFYDREYGNNSLVEGFELAVKRELRKLGAVPK